MNLVQNVKIFAVVLVTVEVLFAIFAVGIIWSSPQNRLTLAILETAVISLFSCTNVFVVLFLLKRLKQMENIVKVCAWTNQIEIDGKWVTIEEFLQRILGVKITHGMAEEAAVSLQKSFRTSNNEP